MQINHIVNKPSACVAVKAVGLLGASLIMLAPIASHGFIDERTAKPVTPTFVPAVQAPVQQVAPVAAQQQKAIEPVVRHKEDMPVSSTITIQEQTVDAGSSNVPAPQRTNAQPSFSPGVMGDINAPVWSEPYPGPYGKMPLADALIAQIVPAVGGAIELNAQPSLLGKTVVVPHGANRISTLSQLAKTENIGVMIAGNTVSLASPEMAAVAPAFMGGSNTVVPGVDVTNSQMSQTQPLRATKSFSASKGTMLSSALLEWAKQWGWDLVWKADVDYRIAAPINLNDDFLGVAASLLDAYRDSNRPLWGDWNESQKVLVIREPSSGRQGR